MRNEIATLHFLTQDLPGYSHEDQVKVACEAGVKWVQLRMKNKPEHEMLRIAQQVRTITRGFNAVLIINDHPLIAKEVEADGVHLGQEDMNWQEARKILGSDFIIGLSVHSFHEIIDAKHADVNYFGLGPYRFTQTKEKLDPVLGLKGIYEIISRAHAQGIAKPIIAIGGIQSEDVGELLKTGVSGIAISSAINQSPEPAKAIHAFLSQLSSLNIKHETFTI